MIIAIVTEETAKIKGLTGLLFMFGYHCGIMAEYRECNGLLTEVTHESI